MPLRRRRAQYHQLTTGERDRSIELHELSLSLRKIATRVGRNVSTIREYRYTSLQALMVLRRYDSSNFIMNRLEVQPTFLAEIIWTDEACFSLNTIYAQQTKLAFLAVGSEMCCRSSTSSTLVDKCLVRNIQKQTDLPIFYEGTLTGYLELPKDLTSNFLEDLPLSDLRFQHDGAPPHQLSSVQQYIQDTFQQQVILIGYGDCDEWPSRSPDLNPVDFLQCGYIK